jgi:hypothetical protein
MAPISRRQFLQQSPAVLTIGLAAPPADAFLGPLLRWMFAPVFRRSAQQAIGSVLGNAARTAGAAAARGGGLSAMGVIGGASAAIWGYLGVREIANIHPEAWERVKTMLPTMLVDRQAGTPIHSQLEMPGGPAGAEPLWLHGGVTAIRPEALLQKQPLNDGNSVSRGVQGQAMAGQPVRIALPMSAADFGPGEWLLSSSLYDVARQAYYEAEAYGHQLQRLVVR